ncbi:MAG: hypothetical protein KGI93_12920 [Acidobacteriota bacterium]|nr:hypothetical protein [Acidobacteriota bacterium]
MIVLVAAAAIQCRARSIGPGALGRGGAAGAACMLAAYRRDCRAADYTLSSFGVDTVRTETFTMLRGANACTIRVTDSFRVVPRPPRVLRRLLCARLRTTSTGGVVADRCTPAATVSLTTLGP